MAEAGYPNGFGVTLDCPNDRYNNDEQICQAVAGMPAGAQRDLFIASVSCFLARKGALDRAREWINSIGGGELRSVLEPELPPTRN